MDVLMMLALAIGLIYCLFSAARWAFRIDSQTSRHGKKSKHRKHKKRNERAQQTAINDAFFAIIRPIWKRPTDEHDPG